MGKVIENTQTSEQQNLKKSFRKVCDSEVYKQTFTNKGWHPVTYALFFRHRDGFLLDYAMTKKKLLLDMRRSIDL